MEINYLQRTQQGHLYQVLLLPACDLDILRVTDNMNLIELVPGSVHPFQYEILKTGTNEYSLQLLLQKSFLDPQILSAELYHLQADLTVPTVANEFNVLLTSL